MSAQEQNPFYNTSHSSSSRTSDVSEKDDEHEKHDDDTIGENLQRVVTKTYNGVKETMQEAMDQITFKQRIKHFTWANFCFPMSTGGIALLLGVLPKRFDGLTTIGTVIYVFDLIVFVTLCIGISARFIMNRGALKWSLTHPTESLFFPTFFLALMNVFAGMQIYGVPHVGPWLITVERVAFWIYVVLTFTSAVCQYTYLFTTEHEHLTIEGMTPGWILPIFPVMLSGTFASLIAATQPQEERMQIIVAGVCLKGLGWMISFMVYGIYIYRLMQHGLPAPDRRPGGFIAVGPPAFTCLALIGLSQALPEDSLYFIQRTGGTDVLRTLAEFVGIFLWGLSAWFFCITLVSILIGVKQMSFRLNWWAFVFPNVGFTIATIRIGQTLRSEGILWFATVMTILLVATWLFVLVSHINAVVKRKIMMPGMDEDKDESEEERHHLAYPTPKEMHTTV